MWNGYGEINGNYWSSLRRTALANGRQFCVPIEYAWQKFIEQERRCAISGEPICFKRGKKEATASLDRIDSKIDYIVGNVQWLHKDVNALKSDFPEDKFIKWCELVVGGKLWRQNHRQKVVTNHTLVEATSL